MLKSKSEVKLLLFRIWQLIVFSTIWSHSNCTKFVNTGSGSVSGTISKNVIISVNVPTVPPVVTTTTANPNATQATTTPPVTTIPIITPNSSIEIGIGCGTKRMKPFEVVRIQSNNFNVTNYPNNDACTWKFIGKECTISAQCPCLDIVPSFDCLKDYLKIIDPPFYHQKFCGSTQPQGTYRASTEVFTMRFKSSKEDTGKGFLCYVQCTPPGYADQQMPNSTTVCPNFTFYF